MKIIIDTDKKTIEVPKKLKEASELLGHKSVLDSVNIDDYKIIIKSTTINKNRVVDKTNAKTIEDFMNKVKDSDKDTYKEYVELKNKVIGTTKNGKEVKTNFLTIKKWFYEKYPSENPLKK